jgi:hypothetical protein
MVKNIDKWQYTLVPADMGLLQPEHPLQKKHIAVSK